MVKVLDASFLDAFSEHDLYYQGGDEIVSHRAWTILPDGTVRRFLDDGDEVVIKAFCERPGAVRIGVGECRGVVLHVVAGFLDQRFSGQAVVIELGFVVHEVLGDTAGFEEYIFVLLELPDALFVETVGYQALL